MPPLPKNTAARRRRNSPPSLALVPEKARRAPNLPPGRDWSAATRRWWHDIWASPMAAQWLESDVHGLLILAALVEQFNGTGDLKVATEIRLQGAAYGLSPLDRRRLSWEVGEPKQRREVVPRAHAKDPREALR